MNNLTLPIDIFQPAENCPLNSPVIQSVCFCWRHLPCEIITQQHLTSCLEECFITVYLQPVSCRVWCHIAISRSSSPMRQVIEGEIHPYSLVVLAPGWTDLVLQPLPKRCLLLIISLCFLFVSFKVTSLIILLVDFLTCQAHFLPLGSTKDLWCNHAQPWKLSPLALSSYGSFLTSTSSGHSVGGTDLPITRIQGLAGECSVSISEISSKSLGVRGGWALAEHLALKARCLVSTDHVKQLMAMRLGHHAWLFWEYSTRNGQYKY